MSTVRSPLAESLVRLRRAAGLSQQELARRSGLSERAIRDLERGVTVRPRGWSLRAIADVLGLDGGERQALSAAATKRSVPVEEPYAAEHVLVGRSAELAQLYDLVCGARHRLVTVTGPGGIGKSRLAAEAAFALRTRAGLDVRVVDLSTLDDPGLVGEVLAEALDAGGRSRLDPVARIAAEIRGRRVVLVLDGFERVMPAAAAVRSLVVRCPGLTTVVTSRLPLRVRPERELRLAPLAVPSAADIDIARLPDVPSVALFVDGALRVRSDFALTAANAGAVVAICRAVEGLPLALELAAARMRLLTPAELASRLSRPLEILSGGGRDAPSRHRSLRATIESSLDVVSDASRTLFAWLAAFPAGARLADLEAVTPRLGVDGGWLLEALGGLVESSLARTREDGEHTRYLLPDAMRELANELYAIRPDRSTVDRVVATHFLDRLRAAGARADGAGYAEIEGDNDNLRAALVWVRGNDPRLVDIATVEALYRLYEPRGRFAEGRSTLIALAEAGAAGAAWALLRAGRLSHHLGDLAVAGGLATRARELLPPDDHAGRALSSMLLGSVALERDPVEALPLLREAIRSAEAAGDESLVGRAQNNLAAAVAVGGDVSTARGLMAEALRSKRRAGANDVDIGRTLLNLTELALAEGDWGAVETFGAEAAAILDHADDPRLRAGALSSVALARLFGGSDDALAVAMRAVRLLDAIGEDRSMRGLVRARYSVVLHGRGEFDQAVANLADAAAAISGGCAQFQVIPIVDAHATLLVGRLPEAAAGLFGLADAVRSDRGVARPRAIDDLVAECRRHLGPTAFRRASERGAGLSNQDLAAVLAAAAHLMRDHVMRAETRAGGGSSDPPPARGHHHSLVNRADR